jgi:DNA repair exonuclease SbcCD ATPase subunit
MKWFLFILFFLFTSVGCSRPHGFTLKKILSEHSYEPRWEVSPPKNMNEIRSFLAQSYTYLGSGNHCYAFVSSDGRYVLKFFKQKHMRTHSMLNYLPLPARNLFYPIERLRRRMQEREESYSSYKIAYEKLQNETGVLFLHLNKTTDLLPHTTLIDQHGNRLKINLNQMEFLLQEKATLAFEYLRSLFDQKEELLDAIDSLLQVVISRNQKGIYDKDLQFYKNFGFRNGKALEVDVGEFKIDQTPRDTLKEAHEVSLQIRDFIQENMPKHLPDVQTRINSTLKYLE